MALIQSTAIPSGATDYELEQSLKFEDLRDASLLKTFGTTNRRTYTLSVWLKLNLSGTDDCIFGVYNNVNQATIVILKSDGTFALHDWHDWQVKTTAVHRDSSAWYHLIVAVDTTQSTETNRVKMYVNGVQQTLIENTSAAGWAGYPSQNYDTAINFAGEHGIGVFAPNGYFGHWNGYMSEMHFIDGTAKAPADFGETGTYGEWKPVEYSGTYGTNGFYLPFKQDYTVEGFSTVLYTGNDETSQYIGGVGFQPDLVWIKERSGTVWAHLFDSVRGVNKALTPHETTAENTTVVTFPAFNSDGFTVGDGNLNGETDAATASNVAWNWDMGGSNATNTNGSITSTVRANTTYGQSIVSFTGTGSSATVGHGLSSKPDVVLTKRRDSTSHWLINDWSGDYANKLKLNDTEASSSSDNFVNDASATTFTLGTDTDVNANNGTYIAYCWHSVTGYSSFGHFDGTGSATAINVTTGFEPAFLLWKIADASSNRDWYIIDNVRGVNKFLRPNLNNDEVTDSTPDVAFTSTGFTVSTTNDEINSSGDKTIYMAFADKREYAYWLDQSGNNNDWTSNNLTESDISVDSPTNNFCTMNPLEGSANGTYSEGNLRIQTAQYPFGKGTFHVSAGKWYWEWTHHSGTYNTYTGIGNDLRVAVNESHNTANTQAWLGNDAALKKWSSTSGYDAGTLAINDIIGIAVDLDNGSIKFYINNTLVGTDTTLPAGTTVTPLLGGSNDGTDGSGWGNITFNFGQDSSFSGFKTAQGNQDGNDIGDFYYTPPTGFLALCTKNLPDVAVTPSEHFNTVTWTGTGSAISVSGVGFSPSLVWGKNRAEAWNHYLFDAVRGTGKLLQSNLTNAETNNDVWGYLSAFNSDGFSLSAGSSGIDQVNDNSDAYVAWNWKANGSGSSNTTGSINTTATSANVDSGFSISTYTGTGSNATVGHGLSKAPEMIICKRRNASEGWATYHSGIASDAETDFIELHSTGAAGDSNTRWNDTAPTSSVFSIGTHDSVNASSSTYVAYCFHSVDGYSKVGSYTGNGNADGTFVYTGFKPMWILRKRSDDAYRWILQDNKRNIHNVVDTVLKPNESTAESTTTNEFGVDFCSNGFKVRASWAGLNANNGNFIYIAFAETPFKYSNAR